MITRSHIWLLYTLATISYCFGMNTENKMKPNQVRYVRDPEGYVWFEEEAWFHYRGLEEQEKIDRMIDQALKSGDPEKIEHLIRSGILDTSYRQTDNQQG